MRAFNPQSVPRPHLPAPLRSRLGEALDLEIGAGQGLHAVQYCARNPGRTLLAVERTQTRFQLLRSRAERHPHLINLLVCRADAIPLVTHFIADESLRRVFLLYPNPCPKPSQANQRWHRSPFMQFLKQKMQPGATLHLATNLEWYAEEAALWMCQEHGFELRRREHVGTAEPGRTHFERKYLARGETCFDLVFEKRLQ